MTRSRFRRILGKADGRAKVCAVAVDLLDLRGRQRPRPDGHREDVALEMVRPERFAEHVLRSREHTWLEPGFDVRREHPVLVEARRRRREARRKQHLCGNQISDAHAIDAMLSQ